MKRYLAELTGTFFLALAINFTGDPVATGLMFMVMIFLMAPVSGAHLNPAISVAMWMRGRLSTAQLPLYIGSQVIGAFLVSMLAYFVAGSVIPAKVIPENALLFAGAFELLLTCILCSVALIVYTTDRFKDSLSTGLALGFTLTALVSFPGLYNPAVALGSLLANLVPIAQNAPMVGVQELVVYVAIPLVAAVIAALKFRWMYSQERTH